MEILVHLLRRVRKDCKVESRITSKSSYSDAVAQCVGDLNDLCICMRAVLGRPCIRVIDLVRTCCEDTESCRVLTVNIRFSRTSSVPGTEDIALYDPESDAVSDHIVLRREVKSYAQSICRRHFVVHDDIALHGEGLIYGYHVEDAVLDAVIAALEPECLLDVLVVRLRREDRLRKDEALIHSVDVGRASVEARQERTLDEVEAVYFKLRASSLLSRESDLPVAVAQADTVRTGRDRSAVDDLCNDLLRDGLD